MLVVPLVAIVLAYFCFVTAEPVELHARREVQRRQQVDNSSVSITTSSSLIVTPTTSNVPPTSSGVGSSVPLVTSHTVESSSPTADSSSSIITSLSRSIRTFTTDVVTTINGVAGLQGEEFVVAESQVRPLTALVLQPLENVGSGGV